MTTGMYERTSLHRICLDHHPHFEQELRGPGFDLWRFHSRPSDSGPATASFDDHQLRGESYRLKERRKAGLVPPRAQDGSAAAASHSLASASVPPKNAPKDGAGLHCEMG